MSRHESTHLGPEELELFLPRLRREERGPQPSARHRRHVEACSRCRRELASLRALDEALADLPYLEPSPRFVDAVMERVRLPAPWYRRLWAAGPRGRAVLVAAAAAALAPVSALVWWVWSRLGAEVAPLVETGGEQLSALAWSALLGLAEAVWASGIPDLVTSVAGAVSPLEAAAGAAVASLLTAVAALTFIRLMTPQPSPRLAGRR